MDLMSNTLYIVNTTEFFPLGICKHLKGKNALSFIFILAGCNTIPELGKYLHYLLDY